MSATQPHSPDSDPPPVETLSFEQALTQLETIVRQLEQGNVDLENAVAAYERGVALRRQCETRLAEARMVVERISRTPDGAPTAEPFDPA